MLKKIIIGLFVCFLASRISAQTGGIRFYQGTFQEALQKACSEKKLLFIDIYTSWCGPCKVLAKTVFADPKVGDFYNRHFICYQLDAEKGDGGKISKQLNVNCFPTLIYLTPGQEIEHRFSGVVSCEEFIQKGKTAMDDQMNLAAFQKNFTKGKREVAFLFQYLKLLKEANMDYKSVADEYWKKVNPAEVLTAGNIDLLNTYLNSMNNPVFSYLLNHARELEQKCTVEFTSNLLEQCIKASLAEALQKKDDDAFFSYLNQISKYSWKGKEKNLLWAEQEFTKYNADWDNYFRSSVIYLDTYDYNNWVNNWKFSQQFLLNQDMPFRADLAIPYAAKAVALMPIYTTLINYAQVLYKTGNPVYKSKILELMADALKYEEINRTDRDFTSDRDFMKQVELMDYNVNSLSPFVMTIQPIVACNDQGDEPASMALPQDLVKRAYSKAGIEFYFLPPIYWHCSNVRDGKINLDSVCRQAVRENKFRGQKDVANMVFVNRIDGQAGPQGRGLQNGNIVFITLGDHKKTQDDKILQAFVIAHELGHNLGLEHTVDDMNVSDSVPNLMGDGTLAARIDPFYSLTSYQLDAVRNSPLIRKRIDCLKRSEGQASILDETFETYFSQLQMKEIMAFTGEKDIPHSLGEARNELRATFGNAVMEFTSEEEQLLRRIVNKVIFTLQSNGLSFMAECPWRFIKISGDICGGMAHTRGNCIILSEKHLQFLMEHKDEPGLLTERIGKLIVHEQLHVLQRLFPDKFRRLNTAYWNFVNTDLPSATEMVLNQVSNPDALKPEWLIQTSDGNYYWPRVLFNEEVEFPQMGKDFVEYAYPVALHKGCYRVNFKKRILLSELSDFYSAFPIPTGHDHPYEIAAYLFGNYFEALLKGVSPFSDIAPESSVNVRQFLKWCKDEVVTDSIKQKTEFLMSQMTLGNKLRMIAGDRSFYIKDFPEIGIPSVGATDGPQGIKDHGVATAFPAPISLAASWNTSLGYAVGEAIAREGKAKDMGILLAPGVNMYRMPLCGRNFEYMGEDPYLASQTAVAYIKGVQDNGMIATVKHFVANNQEADRHRFDSKVDARTLHEIYLPVFKAAVQEGGVQAVMTSYNPLNGVHTSESSYLMNDLLKKEWGFKGIVISDWISVYSSKAALAGLDLEMPSGQYMNADSLRPLLISGQLTFSALEDKVRRIISTCLRMNLYDPSTSAIRPDLRAHDSLACRVAEEGIVLLKNKDILPLKSGGIKVFAPEILSYSGGGAALVTPGTLPRLFNQLEAGAGASCHFTHFDVTSGYDVSLLQDVTQEDIVIVVAGFNADTEGEGFERPFSLPAEQNIFIQQACDRTDRVVVVLTAGGGVWMPWIDRIGALLYCWYPGQAGDKALAHILLGKVCPSGKLPISIEKNWADNAVASTYDTTFAIPGAKPLFTLYGKPHEMIPISYQEGIFTGYRHYDHTGIKPLFPFGFGLSYTSFHYTQVKADKKSIRADEQITFSVTIENKGVYEGAETVQLYIRDLESSLPRPEKELKRFQKVRLKPGEKKQISFAVDRRALQFYDPVQQGWVAEPGRFKVMIGSSSADIQSSAEFELK